MMTRLSSRSSLAILTAALLLFGKAAEAHIGTGTASGGGFAAGFMHPLSGVDHFLAMLSVGLWAGQTGGRSLWIAPLSFLAMMILGGALGMSGLGLSSLESGIAGSVIVLGLAVATAWRPSPLLGGGICGLFALFHGHAHGTEMAVTLSPLQYSFGFVLATATLHVSGIMMALSMRRFGIEKAASWVGAGIAVIGACLLLA